MNYQEVKKRLYVIIGDKKRVGGETIYAWLLERFGTKKADSFMLSQHGGYTSQELTIIKANYAAHQRKKYQRS